jgi:hypothetical protein
MYYLLVIDKSKKITGRMNFRLLIQGMSRPPKTSPDWTDILCSDESFRIDLINQLTNYIHLFA